MRVAFSSIAWNTGSSSPGDELMTLNTSDVAVCCASDSESSLVRLRDEMVQHFGLEPDDLPQTPQYRKREEFVPPKRQRRLVHPEK